MSTKQALRAVEEEEAAEDFASGTEFGPNAMALTDEDFKDLSLGDPKTLVTRARDRLQHIIDGLTTRKAEAEKRIAQAGERINERCDLANRVFQAEVEAAKLERDAAIADAEGDLAQLAACKEAIDLAVGRLNKA